MKYLSKKMCGHGVSVNKKSADCLFHIVCDFWEPVCEEENMMLQ